MKLTDVPPVVSIVDETAALVIVGGAYLRVELNEDDDCPATVTVNDIALPAPATVLQLIDVSLETTQFVIVYVRPLDVVYVAPTVADLRDSYAVPVKITVVPPVVTNEVVAGLVATLEIVG